MIEGRIQFALGRKVLFIQISDSSRIQAFDLRVPESRWEFQILGPKSFVFSRATQRIAQGSVITEPDPHSGKKQTFVTFAFEGEMPTTLKIAWRASRITKVLWNDLNLPTDYRRGGEIFHCADLTVKLSKQTCVDGEFSLAENSKMPEDVAALISSFAWYLDENRFGT